MLKLFFAHIFTTALLLILSVGIPVYSVSELLSATSTTTKIDTKTIQKILEKARGIEVKPQITVVENSRKPAIVKVHEVLDFTPKFRKSQVKEIRKVVKAKPEFKEVLKEKANLAETNIVKPIAKPVINKKVGEIEEAIESNVYELSYKDIEEEEVIEAATIQKVAWVKFSLPKDDYAKEVIAQKTEKTEDRISTIASAQEKSPSEEIPHNNEPAINESSDELVFFDYSEDGKVNTKEVIVDTIVNETESPQPGISTGKNLGTFSGIVSTSQSVNTQPSIKATKTKKSKTPKRRSNPRLAQAKLPSPDEIKKLFDDSRDQKGDDDTSMKLNNDKSNMMAMKSIDYGCLDQSNLKRKIYHNEYSVSLNSVSLGNKNFETIHNFEIRFQDDIDDIAQDFGEGEVQLNYKLSTKMNIRRGVILAYGYYPTAMDFVFEGASARYSIPVFEKEKFNSIINNLGVPALGAHLLVELDDATEDVELDIDTKYDAKIFLDRTFNIVDRTTADYDYIMFVGAKAGNTILNFRDTKNQITNKIVHLTAKEIYYEPNFYAEVANENISFFEEGLRTKCPGLLDIQSKDIKPWSFEGKVTKKSLNTHSVGKMLYPLGTRKYFELGHLEKNIYVGKWSEEEVVVPDAEYADNILNNFDVVEGECLVQLNVSKSIKDLNLNSMDTKGYAQTQVKFLDRDGAFYDEVSGKTSRIFIHGESQGIINLKLDYTDGSSQFVQTYCSDDTYLVEQL